MSLFGESPPESATQTRSQRQSSLFDDKAKTGTKTGSGLFDDDEDADNTNEASPWSMPTPRKAARGDLVKTLLPASEVPESYVDAFDVLQSSEDRFGGGQVSLGGAKKLLESSGLGDGVQSKILKLVTGEKTVTAFERNEINVLIALIGLSQEGDETTLDSVDERRGNLPEPSLPYIAKLKDGMTSSGKETSSAQRSAGDGRDQRAPSPASPEKSRRLRKDSLDNLEADPWASPAMHKGHTHNVQNEVSPADAATSAKPIRNGISEPTRTTSAFTTHANEPDQDPSISTNTPALAQADESGPGWDSYGASNGGLSHQGEDGLVAGGFAAGGAGQGRQPGNPASNRSFGGGRTINRGVEETVTVTLLPEKEGMFLFQHHNYEIKSARRASVVVRRYSDFVWLLSCLHKRYPFRQLPLLPPKTLAVNGNHLSSDATFIEKRRRGLVRFSNALVRHPVLSQEQLVVMFLTVPTHQELSVWRKQATISVQEEFTGKSLLPGLEDSLPTNLDDTFATVRSGVRNSAEQYINLCNLMERLTKRNLGVATDYLRFSQALINLTETSQSTYATDTNDVPLLNEGINSTAKHLTTSQSLLEDESRAWDQGVMEDFKKQRDTLVSIREMFERQDRYAKDNIPQLERRIESNENKLAGLMAGAGGKPGEQEKLEQAVRTDKQSIVDQHARGVFIKECIRDELVFFQQSQYHVSRLHQDWSQERVKYSELQAENWRALSEEVDNMPLGD